MADPPPFLFVVGAGRSGTSVLRAVLDGHRRLAVAHEGRFIYPFSRHRDRYERPDGFAVDAFVADLVAHRGFRRNVALTADELQTAVAGEPVADYPDAVRRVFAAFAATRGKDRWGDKMPAYVLHLPELAAMFPEGRFVHIIRDGRDVALSNLAIPDEVASLVTLALDWKRRVTAGRAAGRALGPERYLEVRYETLITDPRPTVSSVCDFLDLDPEPAMLDFFAREDRAPARVQANPRHARLAEPLSFGPRTWRRDLDRGDLARWEAAAGDLLDELGYERGVPDPPPSARLGAVVGRGRWLTRRARSRAPRIRRLVRAATGRTG